MRSVARKTIAIVAGKLRSMKCSLQGQQCVHLLHIGKTGGTAVQHALKPFLINDNRVVCLHSHGFRLRDVPLGDGVVFFLRDPIARFVSGFYSRQRQGQPRYFIPWRAEEQRAFSYFDTPNKLAICLSSEDSEERSRAQEAMKGITHVKSHYWDWFDNEHYFMSRVEDIVFIGFQESLEKDFQQLKLKLQLPDDARLPTDAIRSHRSPPQLDKFLDAQAVANLRQWYQEDYRFITICQNVIEAQRLG